jgi:hypothetical protein
VNRQPEKEEQSDEGKVLDRTMEQSAFAGTGNPRADLRCRRPIHFGVVGPCGFHRDGGDRGALLNDCRTTYEHAVRMAKEGLS